MDLGLPDAETLHVTPANPTQAVRREPESAEDYITKHMACAPGITSEKWLAFLDELTNGDKEMAQGLQLWIGAAMIPGNAESKSHVFHGDGLTGKSTFLKTVLVACGDYAGSARASVFTSEKENHPAELLPFIDKRIVMLAELPRGSLRSDLLKVVSGGDSISVRGMRENPRTATPDAVLFFTCNELPSIRLVDQAIRRRLMIWPMDTQPRKVNTNLGRELVDDDNMPGVVAWIVDGMKEYIRITSRNESLPIPNAVKVATAEYFKEVDNIGQWRDAMIAETGETPSGELYASFYTWCDNQKRKPLSERAFYLWMGRNYERRHGMGGSLYNVSIKEVAA